jgi:hypothetical protein
MKKMIVASYDSILISVCYLLSFPSRTMTYRVDEKPVLRTDSILVEEKGSTDETLIEKVGCKGRNPPEYVEASTRFENEEGDRLLKE